MIERLLTQPLTVRRIGPAGMDDYGNEIPGTIGEPVRMLGFIDQVSSTETLLDRDTVVSRWVGYLPADTVIGHLDRIEFAGAVFEVDGEPQSCYNPRTRAVSHVRAYLTVVAG